MQKLYFSEEVAVGTRVIVAEYMSNRGLITVGSDSDESMIIALIIYSEDFVAAGGLITINEIADNIIIRILIMKFYIQLKTLYSK